MASRRPKKRHEADVPRVHPDHDPDTPVRSWTTPRPPAHDGAELLIKLDPHAAEAVYVNGVWVNPGEVAWVAVDEARKLIKAGDAEEVA